MGLGNELFGDDAVGLLAVRTLAGAGSLRADFIESSLHGVALLDLFIGYEKAIIVDAIKTGRHPPGTIIEIDPEELLAVDNPSPHFTGVPELIRIAADLKIEFPKVFRIVAMEVSDTSDMKCELTEPVASAMDDFVSRVLYYLD